MDTGLDLAVMRTFGTALLIGALIGIEREKRKAGDSQSSIGGLRTFILLALAGAIGGWLAGALHTPWLLVAVVLVVAGVVLAGYVLSARTDPESVGITTETAAVVVCLLGAMTTLGHGDLAVALGIATAAVLAYKQPLHGFVEKMGWDDILAGLRLLIATFIVLPLLPDRAVDPWGALNPYSLWLLVLLISSLSLVGYVGTLWLGADKGTVLTGITGGLVSSTAVTLSFARQSRADSGRAASYALACGMLLAWCIMFGRVITEVLVVNRAIVTGVLIPFGAMGIAAAVPAWVYFRRSAAARGNSAGAVQDVPLRNPFRLTEAAKFGAFFAAILLLVKFVQTYLPGRGLYMVAALAGLTDVDAITLSMAEFAKEGDARIAVNSIVIATLTNTVVKCAMAATLGGAALRRPVLIATAFVLMAGVAAILAW